MYIAATLDNSSGLIDSSPTFTSFTLPTFANNELSRYSFSAFDVDGDSLVYTSVEPLAGLEFPGTCSTSISYNRSSGGEFVDPITGARITYGPVQFTPAFPFLTYQVVGGNAVPFFQLNAATGELLTRPVVIGYQSVAVRVDEYRRLGGSWQQIGSVTRDIVFRSPNGADNHNPTITEVRVAGAAAPQPVERVIPVRPGQLVSLQLAATDPDAGQTLRISSDVGALIPGATFRAPTAGQAQLDWQVPPQQPLGRYSFTVTVEDSGCPTPGLEVRTITFLVTNQVLATRSRQNLAQPAYPTPFREQVQFQLTTHKAQAVVIVDELGRVVEQLTSKVDGTVVWQPAATVRPGLYIARTADGQQVQRLVRQ
ncbi:T9SS type A sorting domain-containing protein [Hymenobacter sp. GOD-10R]|uniref:T9SS type A sorting domain-containing protein n=1 Tax=Hymenobacter sp. GOD-10R TaxID=3093922 RepID=UPI002D78E54B|nr:T9SS type A sorting domain-containing protein [Hymenobacter sp. GOD-10R]WRQ29626.1 T9SS type A sorting domain-containing protein [Hymenobacter sp. GOD-10R]